MMKLLHHSAALSTSGASICCSCGISNSFLNGSYTAYAVHLGGTWYHFPSFLTFSEKVLFEVSNTCEATEFIVYAIVL